MNILILSDKTGLVMDLKYFQPIWSLAYPGEMSACTQAGVELQSDQITFITGRLSDLSIDNYLYSEDPKEECYMCEGTGFRRQPPDIGAGSTYLCNICEGFCFVVKEDIFSPLLAKKLRNFLLRERDSEVITIRLERPEELIEFSRLMKNDKKNQSND